VAKVEEYWHGCSFDDGLDQSFAIDSDDQLVVHFAYDFQE
jgi:hypothetical protein